MVRKLVTAAFIAGTVMIAGCNTVRGAAADINSAANCTENTVKTGYCR